MFSKVEKVKWCRVLKLNYIIAEIFNIVKTLESRKAIIGAAPSRNGKGEDGVFGNLRMNVG